MPSSDRITSGTLYSYGSDVPLTFQPLDAPRPITRAEAEKIANDEYAHRGTSCLSVGADGGMHFRSEAYSEASARGWRDEKRRGLASPIMRADTGDGLGVVMIATVA